MPTKTERDGRVSDRKEEVLQFVAKGFTDREIETHLEVSPKTVESHKARAIEKLGLECRADIVSHAIQQGWLTSFGQ